MINNHHSIFNQRLYVLLKENPIKDSAIINTIVNICSKYQQQDLLFHLHQCLSMVLPENTNHRPLKEIVELVFDELVACSEDKLTALQPLYGIFNILTLQKLSKDQILLEKLYKSLAITNNAHHSGLYMILTTYKYTLLKMLVILAKDNAERIKYIYTALPIYPKHEDSALSILQQQNPPTNLIAIKNLLNPSFYLRLTSFWLSKQKTRLKELQTIQAYCLECLATTKENLATTADLLTPNTTYPNFLSIPRFMSTISPLLRFSTTPTTSKFQNEESLCAIESEPTLSTAPLINRVTL